MHFYEKFYTPRTLFSAITAPSVTIAQSVTSSSEDCIITFPKVFTPNGDDQDDIFLPQIDCAIETYRLTIYNRWGEKLFSTKNMTKGWNGWIKKKEAPNGVYNYTIEYTFNNEDRKENGSFHLIR